MTDPIPVFFTDAEPLTFAMVLYPDVTLADLAGFQAVLGAHGRTRLLAKTLEPVATDTGLSLSPTTVFYDGPDDLAVLFVPGDLGKRVATVTQRLTEYDPTPPFDAGTPEAAGPEVTAIALGMTGEMNPPAVEIARTRHSNAV